MDQYMCKRSIIILRNLGLSSPKEAQSEGDSCTNCLMHKTRSYALTSHKGRVRGVRDGTGKGLWKKPFKGWTTLNEIWKGTVRRKGAGRLCEERTREQVDGGMLERQESLGHGNPGH